MLEQIVLVCGIQIGFWLFSSSYSMLLPPPKETHNIKTQNSTVWQPTSCLATDYPFMGASFHLLFGSFWIFIVWQGLICPSTPGTGPIFQAWFQEIEFVRDLEEGLPWGSEIEKKSISNFFNRNCTWKINPENDLFQYSRLVMLSNLHQFRRPIWINISWGYISILIMMIVSEQHILLEKLCVRGCLVVSRLLERKLPRCRKVAPEGALWKLLTWSSYTNYSKILSTSMELMLSNWVRTIVWKAHRLAVLKDCIAMQNASKSFWAAAQVKSLAGSWNKPFRNMAAPTASRTTRMTLGLANLIPNSFASCRIGGEWKVTSRNCDNVWSKPPGPKVKHHGTDGIETRRL